MTETQKRNRANRRRGKTWESEIRNGLRSAGIDVETLRQTGTKDEGDLVVRRPDGKHVVVEAKNAAFQPGTFIGEAEVEALHYAEHRPHLSPDDVTPIVIVKRRGANWKKAYVLTTVEHYFDL